ncbi:MAG: type II secretion system F family protein [Candidatus Hydrogenedentota bacterium]
MPEFSYKAKNRSGELVQGVLLGANPREIITRLRAQELTVLNVEEIKESILSYINIFTKKKVKSSELVLFTRMFATLINAGLPIVTSLRTLQEQMSGEYFKEIIGKLIHDIESGSDLSEALSKHPKIFSTMYVDMLRSGEAGGVLDVILERLATYLENTERLRRKIKGAMTYPVVVSSIAILIVWGILTFVVPKFADTFAHAGAHLPLPTRILMFISDLIRVYYLFVFLGFIILYVIYRIGLKNENIRRVIDKYKLKMPVFGELILKVSISRFSRTLGTLTISGVPIIQALNVVTKTAANLIIEDTIANVQESIRSGQTFAQPLKQSGIFPPLVVQMVAVGESTGNLGEMLIKASDFYEEQVDVAVEAFSSLIEPILIVFLGIVLGFVIIALFLPILSLADLIH